MKPSLIVDILTETKPNPGKITERPGIFQFVSLRSYSRKQLEDLLLEAFPQYADEVVDVVMNKYDPNISIGIGSSKRLYGAYFLAYNTIFNAIAEEDLKPLEDLTPYKIRRGVEGVALAVAKSMRGRGIASQLKDYPRTIGVDYIFGLQYKDLQNLEQWKRRRRLVAESDTIYCTLEDVTPKHVRESIYQVNRKVTEEKHPDMASGWSPSAHETTPSKLAAPTAGDIWYFGGNVKELSTDRPLFTTRNQADAEWFAKDRGGSVVGVTFGQVNPARRQDLEEAVRQAKASEEDIQANSPYEGTNFLDYVYVPAVQLELMNRGFDSVLAYDTLSNSDIETLALLPGWKQRGVTVESKPARALGESRIKHLLSKAIDDYKSLIDDGTVNNQNMYEYAEQVARDTVHPGFAVDSSAEFDEYDEQRELVIQDLLKHLLAYADEHIR